MNKITVNFKDQKESEIDQDILDYLPHGSGIDLNWQLDITKSNIILRNAYHCMDQDGFYDGWQDFQIVIPLKSSVRNWAAIFRLQFTNGDYLSRKYNLRDYLEDAFHYALSQITDATLHSDL